MRKRIHLAKNLTNKMFLKWKFYKLRMEEGKDLVEHQFIFKEILDQLKKYNMKIDEEDKTLLLLTLFVDSYHNFVEMI